MRLNSILTIIIIIFSNNYIFSQEKTIDTIPQMSYKELKKSFFESMDVDSLANKYAKIQLKLAKKEKNIVEIANGYMYKSYVSNYADAIKYSDSIIKLTVNLKHKDFPAFGYMVKGYHYYNEGKDKKAVDEYLKADKYAVKNNNLKQQIQIKQFVGGTKYNFGAYKEALLIFKEQLVFLKNQPEYVNRYPSIYLIALDDLSKTFLRGKQPDSALIYIKEGIIKSLKVNDNEMYNRFLSTSGSAYYYKKKYTQALDSLEKLRPKIKDDNNRLAMCLYYTAKIHQLNNINESVKLFNQVDSLYQITNNPFIELRDVYKSLFNYYSTKGIEKEQLNSVKKLIVVDSILDLNHHYSENEIIKKYDIPKLKVEQKKLEQKLVKTKKSSFIISIILSLIIIIALLFIYKFYKTQNTYKNRYLKIVNETKSLNKKEGVKIINNENISISKDIVDDVLEKLEQFEKNKNFLEKGLTLNSISKELNTNSSYLSKIINHYKEQSFSNYLNNLRINYAINELKHNIKFRNYTINAIALEVGFKTAESFSKSFYKEKGIYPSYFIKQLNKS
ncbi:helix-turn-helix transcriptional regulator [uncultured Lacinutrix sp.]|uniref:helix-turn-helix domain-containing protein n=1 Tax=uncultured Lacinutrix sp. TaxID=574032 RepID=UPI002613806A|nr:helix-turn-helix transcriptional regulator [uncultured Lacinutrix sp.]